MRIRQSWTTKARSKKSEKRAAKILNGKVQPASGAINRFDLKADVKTDRFLVDDKITRRASYSLSVKLWRKLTDEAFKNSRSPMMRVDFEDGPTLYVVDEQTIQQLLAENQ